MNIETIVFYIYCKLLFSLCIGIIPFFHLTFVQGLFQTLDYNVKLHFCGKMKMVVMWNIPSYDKAIKKNQQQGVGNSLPWNSLACLKIYTFCQKHTYMLYGSTWNLKYVCFVVFCVKWLQQQQQSQELYVLGCR